MAALSTQKRGLVFPVDDEETSAVELTGDLAQLSSTPVVVMLPAFVQWSSRTHLRP